MGTIGLICAIQYGGWTGSTAARTYLPNFVVPFSEHFHLNSRKEFVSEVNTLQYFYTSQALASATVAAHGISRLKPRRSSTPLHSLPSSAKISTAITLINYALFAELLFLSGSDVLPNPGPVQSVADERTYRSTKFGWRRHVIPVEELLNRSRMPFSALTAMVTSTVTASPT